MSTTSSYHSGPHGRRPTPSASLHRAQGIPRRTTIAEPDPPLIPSVAASSAAENAETEVGWHASSWRPAGGAGTDSAIVNDASNEDNESALQAGCCVEDVAESMDCSLCALRQPVADFKYTTSSCGHRFCGDCLRRYASLAIMESRVVIECPGCPEKLHPNDVRRILGTDARELVDKYEEFALRRLLARDPGARWCPAPDCGYGASTWSTL